MRILITGAAGMLGQDVCAAAQAAGHEPTALTRTELDVTDGAAAQAAVAIARPDIVFNCAAWTNVDAAEESYDTALAVNGHGAGNVARAAATAGAWTIHVSSDYVFDGRKLTPYVESDAVGPISAYGHSKLQGELHVAEAAPGAHTIVRSSWLFGAGGKCFPKTILRLAAERDHLDVVSDQVGCPTFTGHLAAALVKLGGAPPLGVLHVASAGDCSWFQFAEEIVAAGGLECEVRPIDTKQYPVAATRPPHSVLRSERGAPSLPHWSDGLHQFMSQTARAAA
jgi:dTDP-4-dehydrorhamnose reductase